MGCISYYSYIKPQPYADYGSYENVVYRTIPTSNHNSFPSTKKLVNVVYRTIPTSNHNFTIFAQKAKIVVYRTIPTSNHNSIICLFIP